MAEADDAMRERLREAIGHRYGPVDALAAELLPTVRAIVADELRAAARDMYHGRGVMATESSADWLYDRADALDPR